MPVEIKSATREAQGDGKPKDIVLANVKTAKNHQPERNSNEIWLTVAAMNPITITRSGKAGCCRYNYTSRRYLAVLATPA